MRTFSELTKDQLTEAPDSADKLISEKYRSYLPGRLLPLLLGRYRDDLAQLSASRCRSPRTGRGRSGP